MVGGGAEAMQGLWKGGPSGHSDTGTLGSQATAMESCDLSSRVCFCLLVGIVEWIVDLQPRV